MPDGEKVYEFIEDPGQIPMEGVDPVIEKRVKLTLSQRPNIIHLSERKNKPKKVPLG